MQVTTPPAGELNRRITIRLQTDVPNAALGLTQTFSPGVTRWAKREPVHSLALRAGMQTGELPTDLFWVRAGLGSRPADFTAAHVIDFEGRRYRVIDAIDVADQRTFTRVSAKELGPAS